MRCCVSSCCCSSCATWPKFAFHSSDSSLACTACAAASPGADFLPLALLDPASEPPPPPLRVHPCWSLALPAEPSDSPATSAPHELRYSPKMGCGVRGVGSSSGGNGTAGISSSARARASSIAGRSEGSCISCCTDGLRSGFLHSILHAGAGTQHTQASTDHNNKVSDGCSSKLVQAHEVKPSTCRASRAAHYHKLPGSPTAPTVPAIDSMASVFQTYSSTTSRQSEL